MTILVRPKYFPDLTTQDYVNGFTTAITLYFRLEHEERKSQKTQLPPKDVCRDNGHINFNRLHNYMYDNSIKEKY